MVKMCIPFAFGSPLLEQVSHECKGDMYTDIWIRLLVKTKQWKQLNVHQQCINKWWCLLIMKYYIGVKMNKSNMRQHG